MAADRAALGAGICGIYQLSFADTRSELSPQPQRDQTGSVTTEPRPSWHRAQRQRCPARREGPGQQKLQQGLLKMAPNEQRQIRALQQGMGSALCCGALCPQRHRDCGSPSPVAVTERRCGEPAPSSSGVWACSSLCSPETLFPGTGEL